MYMNLIISYTNQPLFLALGGGLKEKMVNPMGWTSYVPQIWL